MSVIKVLEILTSSDKSWEEATQNAVTEASKTVRELRSVNIQNFSATIKDGKISEYRVNCKITFEIE